MIIVPPGHRPRIWITNKEELFKLSSIRGNNKRVSAILMTCIILHLGFFLNLFLPLLRFRIHLHHLWFGRSWLLVIGLTWTRSQGEETLSYHDIVWTRPTSTTRGRRWRRRGRNKTGNKRNSRNNTWCYTSGRLTRNEEEWRRMLQAVPFQVLFFSKASDCVQ